MPAHNPMALLTRSGILEQSRGRSTLTLRVSPRFLAHAEQTSARLAQQGRHLGIAHALETALSAWDDYRHDVRPAALFLAEFLNEREQMGGLRPVFPSLEHFALAA
jgi:hypothetical protein